MIRSIPKGPTNHDCTTKTSRPEHPPSASLTPNSACHAGRPCPQAPCFQVLLESPGRLQPARMSATACASHLGEVVCDLTAWAREHGLTCGQVTVLAVDRSLATCQAADPADQDGRAGPARRGFVFSTIPL
jgi:hypothetical protein